MAHHSIKLLTLPLFLLLSAATVHAEDCDRAAQLFEEARQSAADNSYRAERKLREAVGLCSKSPSLHYNLGGLLYASGNLPQAQVYFEEALKLKPAYANAMGYLAKVLFEQNKEQQYNRSLQLVRQAVTLEPNNRKVRATLEQIEEFIDVPPVTTLHNADAIAVVIGNKQYTSKIIPRVDYADHDAAVVKKYLVEALGFREKNILFYKDATSNDLREIFGDSDEHKGLLYNFTTQGTSDIFIFYSGHGAPDTNTKKAFLAPVDMNPNKVRLTSYSLDLLYTNLARLAKDKQPKSITVVLDACFSGASERGMIIPNASPIFLEVDKSETNIGNSVIFTSSKSDQISSWYPEQQHGLFTYHFLKAVRDILAQGTPLTAAAIEQKLLGRDGVNATALRLHSREQTPQVIGENKSISLLGVSK